MTDPDGATPLDPDEQAGLKIKSIETRAELNRYEQANLTKGREWLRRQRNPDVLSEQFIREFHGKLFGQVWSWAGTFRKTEKNIGIDPMYIGVELRQLVDNTRYWIEHHTYPPNELALRFHHRMVQIHLFANGNGRHARLMTDAVCKYCLAAPQIDWLKGAENLEAQTEHRSAYIAALRAADAGDFIPLLTLFS